MPRRPFPTRCTRQTPSFHPNDHVLAKTASASRRARPQACSRLRAPTHRSRRRSPASNKPACRNNHPLNPLRILIYNQMALQTLHLRLSWQTRCARVASRREYRQPRPIHFLQPPNNFRRPLPYPLIMRARRSQIHTCSRTTSRRDSTHNLRRRSHQQDPLRPRIRCLAK